MYRRPCGVFKCQVEKVAAAAAPDWVWACFGLRVGLGCRGSGFTV